MNGPVRHVAFALLGLFAIMLAAVTWIQAVDADRYREDPRNIRLVADRAGNERGPIISVDGVMLAESVADPEDARSFIRHYPHGPLYAHVVGHDSFLFGARGIESTRSTELTSERDSTLSWVTTCALAVSG